MKKFNKANEKILKDFYDSIPKDKKRLFVALKLMDLEQGSEQYLADLFDCDLKTIAQGKKELKEMCDSEKN